MSFPCSKSLHGSPLPWIKTKRHSLQKEALHDLGPVTPLAFAQDLLWGTPISPWRPAPTSTAKRGLPGLLWPLLPLDFYLPLPSGHISK